METIDTAYLKANFESLQSTSSQGALGALRKEGFREFIQSGIPTAKNEEWRFTPIGKLFTHEYALGSKPDAELLLRNQLESVRLPGSGEANELVFVNGKYHSGLSAIRSAKTEMEVQDLESALRGAHKDLVLESLGKSSTTVRDGLQALNTSFISEGVFLLFPKNREVERPVIFYHLIDASQNHALAQPRILVYLQERASVQIIETSFTTGAMDSFTNEVMEVVVDRDARLHYYSLQQDRAGASQVHTVHIRQIARSFVHGVTISLDGAVIRNNTNLILEAEGCESHLYGLYLLKGETHVDNHTLVDNQKPNCYSNEFYKGILDGHATGVFNGKIFVRPDAQKTNAYQSNKNILLSDGATINTKPQLEIFADDVKCSHGCTVGQLDPEALFYLQSRGVSRDHARSMLLNAFASDIVDQIKWEPLRESVQESIARRLSV